MRRLCAAVAGVSTVVLMATAGCSSLADRIVADALLIPWQQSDYAPSTATTMGPALARLEARLAALGVQVEYLPLGGTNFGLTDTIGWHIDIEESLMTNGRLEVLAHEAGHLFQPTSMSLAERQAFAELVGAEVCARLGWEMGPSSARYLGQFKPGLAGALASKVDRAYAVRILLGEEDADGPPSRK